MVKAPCRLDAPRRFFPGLRLRVWAKAPAWTTEGDLVQGNPSEYSGAQARGKTNLRLVLSGDVEVVKAYLEDLAGYVKENPGLRVIFREISGDRLWIRKGESKYAPEEVA